MGNIVTGKGIQAYIDRIKELQGSGDTEYQHRDADDILCEVLYQIGLHELVREYKKVDKWYA